MRFTLKTVAKASCFLLAAVTAVIGLVGCTGEECGQYFRTSWELEGCRAGVQLALQPRVSCSESCQLEFASSRPFHNDPDFKVENDKITAQVAACTLSCGALE